MDQPRPPARMPHRLYRVLGTGIDQRPNVVLMYQCITRSYWCTARSNSIYSQFSCRAISSNYYLSERNQISTHAHRDYIVSSYTDNYRAICSVNNSGIIHNWYRSVAKTHSIHDTPPRSQILSFESKGSTEKQKDNYF